MFTKAYLINAKCFQAYISGGANIAFFPRKREDGTQCYIGPGPTQNSSMGSVFAYIHASANSTGIAFSDVQTPFVDDDTVYHYPIVSGISCAYVSSINNGSTSSKMSVKLRYNLTNSTSSDITLYKMLMYTSCAYNTTQFSTPSVNAGHVFLAMVKELDNPVTVPANGDAIIDVVIDVDAS